LQERKNHIDKSDLDFYGECNVKGGITNEDENIQRKIFICKKAWFNT
jgi:hypothetical protein